MSIRAGSQIKQYTINRLIARGGMGEVWMARDESQGATVAIKAVANDLLVDPQFKERIQDEAERHRRLEHRNIISVLEVFETGDETCIVMEYIAGTSLDLYLEAHDPPILEPKEAVRIIIEVLCALDYAHQKRIIHRDVKPSNILLDETRQVQLIDFGIALAVGEERRTRAGQTIGTPLYMSPEQIARPKTVIHLSDVYSSGCVLYEMLTGRPPFINGEDGIGETDFSIQEAHVKKHPLNPISRVRQIPVALDRLVMEALIKNPMERIPGCREFIRLLESVDLETAEKETDFVAINDNQQDPIELERFKWERLVCVLVLLLLALILLSNLS